MLLDEAATAPHRFHRNYLRGGVISLAGVAIALATFVLVQHLSLKPPRTSASNPAQEKTALALPSIPSIAVLPFTNLSGDPQQEYFSDGISDQIINDLSRLPGVFVIARNSSFAYKNSAIKEHDVGKELGVKYVLEGSAQKSPDRVRIGVELVDASSGAEMWAQRFDRPLKGIFAVQDEIVGKVVTTLGLIFKREEVMVPWGSVRPTDDLEAFDDLLRVGEYAARFTKEDNSAARHWAEKAVALDPRSADAYVGLAGSYLSAALFRSDNPEADLNHASELAQKALDLDDSNSAALPSLCEIHWMQRRFDQAVAEGERAVAINPNFASGYQVLSDALTQTNRPEEAVRAAKKAMRLDPSRQDFYAFFIATPYVLMGRYQDAIPLLKRHLALYPNQLGARFVLILAYTELAREQDARHEAAELKRINPQFSYMDISKDAAVNKRWENDLRKAGLK